MRQGWGVRIIGLLATAAAIGSLLGCGGSEGDSAPPFTVSDSEVRAECLFGTYLPEQVGTRAAERPPPRDWRRIEDAPGALQPDRAAVALTIRPRHPGERIALTGIRLDVDQHLLRPLGTVFYRPCKRQLRGPAIAVDVDGAGHVSATSAALDGAIGPGLRLPADARPIAFPWSVPLDRPLRIFLIAHSEHCYCTWKVLIPWRSESGEGVIRADNGGRGYTMTDSVGVPWNQPAPNGGWAQVEAPRWTGVR